MHGVASLLFTLLFAVIFPPFGRSESAAEVGIWTAKDGNQQCIMLKAEIVLILGYITVDEKNKEAEVTVPKEATSVEGSSCNRSVSSTDGLTQINSQVLRISFNKGWYVEFYFTMDEAFGTSDNVYVLYAVFIYANYSSMPDKFPSPLKSEFLYKEDLNPKGGKTPDIASQVTADAHYSFYCPSKQLFRLITEDDGTSATASLQLRKLQVQAYMDRTIFSERETCPADDHEKDLLPIIIGSVLAGLVVFTLVAYLIYRYRLPPEVINLTNPHSHMDDIAMYDNKTSLAQGAHDDEIEQLEAKNLHTAGNGEAHLDPRTEHLTRQSAVGESEY